MQIEEVTSRSDLRRFVSLPRDLYAGLPGFEPPLDFERAQLLDPKHSPFFTHGEAAFFLATEAGRPVGRITAQWDRLTPADRSATGHFGALDAVDDPKVVAALLGAARDWHARRGRPLIEGPYTFSINEEVGLQIEGQQRGAMVLMPWHPPYLGAHVEAAGLAPVKDLLAYELDLNAWAGWKGLRLAKVAAGSRVTARDLNLSALDREAAVMADLFNASWKDNWGFIPMAAAELAALLKVTRPILKPSYAAILEVGGAPAAFVLALPNVSELVRGLEGRLLPLGWAKIVWRVLTHRFAASRILLLGVRADLRDTLLGAALPIVALARLAERNPVKTELEMSWILDDNMRMRRIIEEAGGRITKRYRLYRGPAAKGDDA